MLCIAPGGNAPDGPPAPVGRPGVLAGRSNTTQCQKPLPVGASGSYIVTAKLLVPAGALVQLSWGLWLFPVQPMPLKTCCAVACPPTSELVRVKVWAEPDAERSTKARRARGRRIRSVWFVREQR